MRGAKVNLKFVNDRSEFRTADRVGISLHCHTQHSREVLDFVPFYARQFPIVSWIFEQQSKRFERVNGRAPNFNLGHWGPPLTGAQVFDAESESLASLSLESIVSITDHDSIAANLEVNESIENDRAPISLEWTVPYGSAYFHVGVHNLPAERAESLSAILIDYSFAQDGADPDRLRSLLHLLNEIPEVLVVLNHPFWDIEMIGQQEHDLNLGKFVEEFGEYIHALEVNGFRSWAENKQAIELAEQMSIPLVSGGDRHCLSANTMINTTDACTFAEFVEEIRVDGHSNIVIFPEYNKPLLHRQIRSISQVLGHYPEFPEARRCWSQRVFFDCEDGNGAVPLADRWGGKVPAFYSGAIWIISQLGNPALIPIFERLRDDDERYMEPGRELNGDLTTNEWYARLKTIWSKSKGLRKGKVSRYASS